MITQLSAQNSVVVIDTRCELGGPGSIAHPSLSQVRRVVPRKGEQASAIREAITRHTVTVVVVDELCELEEFGFLEEARVRNVRFILLVVLTVWTIFFLWQCRLCRRSAAVFTMLARAQVKCV
jgi:stage III sporulation protein SpoIIIAA